MNCLASNRLRLKWQVHLLHFMVGHIGELNGIIKVLWDKHPQVFYSHHGNGKKVSTKNYLGLLKYITKCLAL